MDKTTACPYFKSTQILRNTTISQKWYCENCGNRFNEPVKKPKQTDGLSGLPKKLLERGKQ